MLALQHDRDQYLSMDFFLVMAHWFQDEALRILILG